MNQQGSSIVRLELCAARLNLICNVRDIAHKMFECHLPWFDHRDLIIVDGAFSEVRICYVSTKASDSDDRSFIDCRLHFDSRVMWISSIQVPAFQRRQGVGRQLVGAAEATANALGMEDVRLLPMVSSINFWLKLDYAPDSRSARVLRKKPAAWAKTSDESLGQALCTSRLAGIDRTATTSWTSRSRVPGELC